MFDAMDWTDICDESELNEGEMRAFQVGSLQAVIYRVEGQFYATQNICPHGHALLSDGWLDGDEVECPLHGALFNVRDGSVTRGPATCGLQVLAVRNLEGKIQLRNGGANG